MYSPYIEDFPWFWRFLNYLFIRLRPNRIHKIPLVQNLPPQKAIFSLRVEPENSWPLMLLMLRFIFLGKRLVERLWIRKWNVVDIKADFQKMNLLTFLYSKTIFLERYSTFITKHLSPLYLNTTNQNGILKASFYYGFYELCSLIPQKLHIIALTPEAEPRNSIDKSNN